jgi:hypothetical protein
MIPLEEFLKVYGDTVVKFSSSHAGKATYFSDLPPRGESKLVVRVSVSRHLVEDFEYEPKVSELLQDESHGWGEVHQVDFVNPSKLITTTRRN